MPRLVRRTPLLERIKAYLDPYDFLLWVSEEYNDDTYEEWLKAWATPIGIGFNLLFILARGACKPSLGRGSDDIFGEVRGSGSGWFAWFATFLVYVLMAFCCWNALATFMRKRHYRLFEQPVDEAPATPSAHRVRIDSSPMSSSPLRYLQNIISATTASARAYPDAEREVWELDVWDPNPLQLKLFTLFSPGHLLLYYSLLPPGPLDPRPFVTVVNAIGFAALLSLQLSMLKSSFSQQSKDTALVHGEVMSEYDTKFVHPSLSKIVRDVGTQTRESTLSPRGARTREVDIYTPTTIVKRSFKTNPNPNYAMHYDPDNLSAQAGTQSDSRRSSYTNIGVQNSLSTPSITNATPQVNGTSYFSPRVSASGAGADYSSPLKPHHERLRDRTPAKGDGGSMGVYSHAASPLRKAASANQFSNSNAGRTEELRSGSKPAGSPLKRMSTPGQAVDRGSGGGVNGVHPDRHARIDWDAGASAAAGRRRTGNERERRQTERF